MNKTHSSRRPLLPEEGEQVMVQPCGKSSDCAFLAVITKSTPSTIRCSLKTAELEHYLPGVSAHRASLISLLKPAQRTEVEVSYARDGGVYRFTTQVRAQVEGAQATLIFSMPETLRKCQRRHNFRLPLAAGVSLRRDKENQVRPGSMINLSATGAMVICQAPIPAGEFVEMTVDGNGAAEALNIIHAVVVDCIGAPDQTGLKTEHTLRLAFDDGKRIRLPVWQKEQLAHYIFEQQRQMLRLRTIVGGDVKKSGGLSSMLGNLGR